MVDTKGYQGDHFISPSSGSTLWSAKCWTYDLELDWHDAEVENLDCRPKNEVGLQCRQVDVTELASQSSSSATLGDRHETEKAHQT